ncbi:MAG TPA: hypothetical protein VJT72_13485, partial [Pseudonocardiaceae bacterium]|nr:hypothetical protein [Pseudonocardiaceae bacterium]
MRETVPPETSTVCRYPGCARPRKPATASGQRPMYCEDPDHNPTTALRARRRLEREQSGVPVGESGLSLDRPVTMGRASAGQLSEQLQAMLGEFGRVAERAVATL